MSKPPPASSYRIRLEREDTGATICTWGRIPAQRITPLLRNLKGSLPFMIAAARARHAFDQLVEAFR